MPRSRALCGEPSRSVRPTTDSTSTRCAPPSRRAHDSCCSTRRTTPPARSSTRDELEAIAAVCVEHDLLAVTDEVYEHLVFDGEHIPLVHAPGHGRTHAHDLVGRQDVLVHGLEDRVGDGPADLVGVGARRRSSGSPTSTARPFQYAVALGLGLGDDVYAALADDLRDKRDHLCEGLVDAGFEIFVPAGTYFVTADVRSSARTTASRSAGRCPSAAAWSPCRTSCSTTTSRRAGRSCASRSASGTRCSKKRSRD